MLERFDTHRDRSFLKVIRLCSDSLRRRRSERRSLTLSVLLHNDAAADFLTQLLSPCRREQASEFQSRSALKCFEGNFKVLQRLIVRDAVIGEDEGSQADFSTRLAILCEDYLVEVCWNGNVRWMAYNLIRDTPLAIYWVPLR